MGALGARPVRGARNCATSPHAPAPPVNPQPGTTLPAERYATNEPGITARGPNFARTRSATSSTRRTFSSTGSKVS